MSLRKLCVLVLSIAAIACMTATVASAALVPSTDGWTLTPVVNGSSVTFLLGIDNMSEITSYDGTVTRSWGDPTLTDSTKFLTLGTDGGILQALTVTVNGDPSVDLKFSCVAGSGGQDFTFYSNLLQFTTINPAHGTATAGITVTDITGDGAAATGAFDGKMYRAYCGPASGMMTFASLIGGPVTAPMYESRDRSETTDPLWQPISGPVNQIQSQFSFHLTGGDSASGTSHFQVEPVPEPSSVLALLCGSIGLVGFIKRRRS